MNRRVHAGCRNDRRPDTTSAPPRENGRDVGRRGDPPEATAGLVRGCGCYAAGGDGTQSVTMSPSSRTRHSAERNGRRDM